MISLCSLIVTEVIANRLKEVWKEIISPNKTSFIQGRQEIDNVIVYQDVLHSLKQRKEAKGGMIIKLDLKKAYDHMEWALVWISYKMQGSLLS